MTTDPKDLAAQSTEPAPGVEGYSEGVYKMRAAGTYRETVPTAPAPESEPAWTGQCPGETRDCEAPHLCKPKHVCFRNDVEFAASPSPAEPSVALPAADSWLTWNDEPSTPVWNAESMQEYGDARVRATFSCASCGSNVVTRCEDCYLANSENARDEGRASLARGTGAQAVLDTVDMIRENVRTGTCCRHTVDNLHRVLVETYAAPSPEPKADAREGTT